MSTTWDGGSPTCSNALSIVFCRVLGLSDGNKNRRKTNKKYEQVYDTGKTINIYRYRYIIAVACPVLKQHNRGGFVVQVHT